MMDDCFISIPINDGKNICLSPIPAEYLSTADGLKLGDDYGIFLYETSSSSPGETPQIIGKLMSAEAAEKIAYLLEVAYRALGINRPIERYLPATTDDQ
jgi:hypothetical protein